MAFAKSEIGFFLSLDHRRLDDYQSLGARTKKKTYLINLLWLEVGGQLLSYDVAMVCGQLLTSCCCSYVIMVKGGGLAIDTFFRRSFRQKR